MATITNEMRFLGVNSSLIDLVEKKDSTNNEKTEYYSLDDIRGYKVYTALLTQSGEDDPQTLLSQDTPSLTIGVTYQITDDGGSGWDFTNVGAPNNDLDTYFIATGTTPANWGTNGMLTYNTGAPTETVLENTIGNIWFTYYVVGSYYINSNELFTDKTFIELSNVTNINNNQSGSAFIGIGLLENSSFLTIQSVGLTDGDMFNTPIEIRVYN